MSDNSNSGAVLEKKSVAKLMKIHRALEKIQIPETRELDEKKVLPLLRKKSGEDFAKFLGEGRTPESLVGTCWRSGAEKVGKTVRRHAAKVLEVSEQSSGILLTLSDVCASSPDGKTVVRLKTAKKAVCAYVGHYVKETFYFPERKKTETRMMQVVGMFSGGAVATLEPAPEEEYEKLLKLSAEK